MGYRRQSHRTIFLDQATTQSQYAGMAIDHLCQPGLCLSTVSLHHSFHRWKLQMERCPPAGRAARAASRASRGVGTTQSGTHTSR